MAKRLAKRPGTLAFAGDLTSGPTKFRVLPPDPDAAKKPRIANNPGQYALGGNATLAITRRPVGERIANEATIQFSPPDATKPVSAKPHKIALPDGYGTWAAAWMRGSNVFWVMQRWGIWSYDFSDPADVKETHLEHAAASDKVPKPILDALRQRGGLLRCEWASGGIRSAGEIDRSRRELVFGSVCWFLASPRRAV